MRAYDERAPAPWPAVAVPSESEESHTATVSAAVVRWSRCRHRRQLERRAIAEHHVGRERDPRLVPRARRIARRRVHAEIRTGGLLGKLGNAGTPSCRSWSWHRFPSSSRRRSNTRRAARRRARHPCAWRVEASRVDRSLRSSRADRDGAHRDRDDRRGRPCADGRVRAPQRLASD